MFAVGQYLFDYFDLPPVYWQHYHSVDCLKLVEEIVLVAVDFDPCLFVAVVTELAAAVVVVVVVELVAKNKQSY